MIKNLSAREILDSRGNPTLEVSLVTTHGEFVSSVPSGASTGSHEAKEIRDGDKTRYSGKGVLDAVKIVNEKIAPALKGKDLDPSKIDEALLDMDGTKDKSNLGGNALLGVSMSAFRAGAKKENLPLWRYLEEKFSFKRRIPRPCFNIVNGGKHSGGGASFQEFMIVPQEDNFAKNLQQGVETYYKVRQRLIDSFGESSVNIGDEGGFVPAVKSSNDILEIITKEGLPVIIDAAANEFFDKEYYLFDGEKKTKEEMIDVYKKLQETFPLLGIEDPLEEEDFAGWSDLFSQLEESLVIGDDLLTTNTQRMEIAKEKNSCNAMIVKINQIGCISQAVDAVKRAKEYGWKTIVSHRSGETNDDFIADFAVGVGSEFIKSGAPTRGERVAKYNRLLQIEKDIAE